MEFLESIWNKARQRHAKIVLPETNDLRVLKAAALILQSKLAEIILIGNEKEIFKTSESNGINLQNVQIADPFSSSKINHYCTILIENRRKKSKDIEFSEAKKLLLTNFTYFGAMMVAHGDADGMVSGASNPTANTIKAAIHSVGLKDGISLLSSFFVMIAPNKQLGANGILFFSDCAVVPDPNEKELCDIAISTAESFRQIMGKEPKIAILSFSTFGSGKGASPEKVKKAAQLAGEKAPNLIIEGEIQADAALIPSISKMKAPTSKIAGKANVLIFPNLDAGNIGYKLTERIGGAVALGPIFQGCAKPINDLSRGCSVDDIVNTCALTAVQTQNYDIL